MTGPPRMAGAVDLGALKRPAPIAQQQAMVQVLTQLGLRCACGRPIVSGGVEVIVVVASPRGPGATRQGFCSAGCEARVAFGAAVDGNAVVVVERALPPNTWLRGLPPTST